METIPLLQMAAVAITGATLAVSTGVLLCRLIRQSGPGSFMWHE